MKYLRLAAVAASVAIGAYSSWSCSRMVFHGDSTDAVVVGRTLDWRTPIPTNIYVYPAGIDKESMPSGPRYQWVSKYGSVLAVGYDGGVTEGFNDRGLAMNGLFCRGTEYKYAVQGSDMKVMSLAMIVSYFLDNFATVDEAESWLREHEFGINGQTFDGGTVSQLHWALTDRSGTTLIMEYDAHGNLNLYKSKKYNVMTNNPPFPQMLAITDYWLGEVGGKNMLPGTVRSSDRFVRASYFLEHQPTAGVSDDKAITQMMSLINDVSVPADYYIEDEPNLSMTQWSSMSDLHRLRYYFRLADDLGYYYVDLQELMLKPGSPVLKLDTLHHGDYIGCANKHLRKSEPFKPMY